ncbi:MAG TPA: hypothetical protein PK130_00855 [Candidatus Pacearchaeota archaeon]|nr:hypothetical protein [Candidatus Pacearchaeota archaeon]
MEKNFTDIKMLFFNNKSIKQTIFKNSFWLTVAEVIQGGIGFLISIWMARYFGPTIYGQWVFALSFVALFAVFDKGLIGKLVYKKIPNEALRSLSKIKLSKDSKILDVGCGSGYLLFSLQTIWFKIKEIVYDFTEFQFWESEQNKNNISRSSNNSYDFNPSKSIFLKKDIKIFKKNQKN